MEPELLVPGRVYFTVTRPVDGALPSPRLYEYLGRLSLPTGCRENDRFTFIDCANDMGLETRLRLISLGMISSEWKPSGPRKVVLTEADVRGLLNIKDAMRALGTKGLANHGDESLENDHPAA